MIKEQKENKGNKKREDIPCVSEPLCGLAHYFYCVSEDRDILILDAQGCAYLACLLCEMAHHAVTMEEQYAMLRAERDKKHA